MAITSNYLKIVWNDLKSETKQNPLFILAIFVLLSIPLPYAYSGICVGLFAFVSLISFKKVNFSPSNTLVYPILLFLLMALSVFWSRDQESTIRAISKVLPLLILPVCFMTNKPFSELQKQKILKYYSFGIIGYITYYLSKALVTYLKFGNYDVFFYHKLVNEDINAIHVSIYATIAFFYFYTNEKKSIAKNLILFYIGIFIILLSSKNIIILLVLLIVFKELFYFKGAENIKWITLILVLSLFLTVFYSSKISNRFLVEFQTNQNEGTLNESFKEGNVYNVSIKQAWNKEKFQQNEYFPGAAFRVYQYRIFSEMLHEDPIFFSGYGLNATDFKIEEKGKEHNIFLGDSKNEGYQKKNFHNQYIQFFAELGIFGLILIILMVLSTLNIAIKKREFLHISFAILMISLFITESFLSRQRGIIFFAMMYCLFNSTSIYNSKTI